MLVLLPPSETKRVGGDCRPWTDGVPASVAFESLRDQREVAIRALIELSADEDRAARVLKLSERQRAEVTVNAQISMSPTMPAVDRYTGVLFDALGAGDLSVDARDWLGRHVAIHSAPFGLVGALDPIPAYRLGAGISVPGLGPARRHWSAAVTGAIREANPAFVLDLRSEAYGNLGPVPDDVPGAYVRVVTRDAGGGVRALNHFNKKAKGELVRLMASTAADIRDRRDLFAWAEAHGVEIHERGAGVDLVTDQVPVSG